MIGAIGYQQGRSGGLRIDPFPPGLVNRYVYSRRDRAVVVDETWDLSVSGCPMISVPWGEVANTVWPYWVRRVEMTQAEFAHSNVPPKLG